MAQKVQVILEDDVDGSEGAETVQFALDGVSTRSTCRRRTPSGCATRSPSGSGTPAG
nr:histone-like nucleoid-structuring protein Lsr2 [Angustibacter aerolatus]